jgi:hypothetical protein
LQAQLRAELFQPGAAAGRRALDRVFRRVLLPSLHAGQTFLAGSDQAAERHVAAGAHKTQQDHQVVQPHDRPAGVAADDQVFVARLPVARGAGDDQVAGLGIDEDVLDPLEPGQHEHLFGRLAAGGQPQLDLLFQPRQGDHSQRRRPADILLSSLGNAGVVERGQRAT